MKKMEYVTVYGASSPAVDDVYKQAAREVGSLLAAHGVGLVCGAGRVGLMGAAIDGALAAGGHATGVIPRFMVEKGWNHPELTEMIVTEDMHRRKETMLRMARGVIALPGGVGTLEELLEAITWRQLGLYHGNIVILNTAGYYNPLIEMLERTIERGFMRGDHSALWQVASTPAEAVDLAVAADTHATPFSQKIPSSN
ncbi:MAG: TIGR00730 family Rossman fold protein [Muribaculaceae bacterium]|nr:TIGR00730 family Rossman fold protein [Muribaculaceae bacterium]